MSARRVLAAICTAGALLGTPTARATALDNDDGVQRGLSAFGATADDTESQVLSIGNFQLDVQGEVSDVDRGTLERALKTGLRRGRSDTTAVGSARDARSCRDVECRQRVAKKYEVDYLVQARVSVRARDYAIHIEAIDASSGEVVADRRTQCDICGITEAASMLQDAASHLRNKLDVLRQVAELQIYVQPAGASIFVDGKFHGVAPLVVSLAPGEHLIEVSEDGFLTAKRQLTLVGGVRERQEFTLERSVELSSRRKKWAISALTVGGIGIGVGALLIGMHGGPDRLNCAAEKGEQDDDGDCEHLWESRWFGFGATAAGAALAGWGATMLWGLPNESGPKSSVDQKKQAARRIHIGIGRSQVSIRARF